LARGKKPAVGFSFTRKKKGGKKERMIRRKGAKCFLIGGKGEKNSMRFSFAFREAGKEKKWKVHGAFKPGTKKRVLDTEKGGKEGNVIVEIPAQEEKKKKQL